MSEKYKLTGQPKKHGVLMTALENKMATELRECFAKANWNSIVLTMEVSHEEVTITPIHSCDCTQPAENTVQHFEIISPTVKSSSYHSIEEISNLLINYDGIWLSNLYEKEKCLRFYNNYIKGHKMSELKDGNSYLEVVCEEWYDGYRDIPLREFAKHYDMHRLIGGDKDTKYVRKALNLALNVKHYNDWYKELYGISPILNKTIL